MIEIFVFFIFFWLSCRTYANKMVNGRRHVRVSNWSTFFLFCVLCYLFTTPIMVCSN